MHSVIEYPGENTTGPYALNFTLGFLSREHIHALVEYAGTTEPRNILWVNDSLVYVDGAPILPEETLVFTRITPIVELQHNFQNGAVLSEQSLDEANLQVLMFSQEVADINNSQLLQSVGFLADALLAVELARGPKGDTGVKGVEGLQGLPGDPGPKGETGIPGVTGPQGPVGNAGPQGVSGLTGATGPQGPLGNPGPQGLTGLPGVTGVQGTVGPQGAIGAAGPQGLQGIIGVTGVQGPVGPDGPMGSTGIPGSKGDAGDQGPQGVQGAQGPIGPTGNTGAQGPQGAIGPTGLTGLQGDIGATGNTGAQGAQGPQGIQGDIGPTGVQGLQGPLGNVGPQGLQGPTGVTGAQGPIGNQGPQGLTGVVGDTLAHGVTLTTGGYLRYGKTSFTDTTAGFYLGADGASFSGSITGSTITGSTVQTATSGERFVVDVASKAAHFYDSTGTEKIWIGTATATVDTLTVSTYAVFGATSDTKTGMLGVSGAGLGVMGYSSTNIGVRGGTASGYGAVFDGPRYVDGVTYAQWYSSTGTKGPIQLGASSVATAPTHAARCGTLWVTYSGVLYINISPPGAGTNGEGTTWQKVGAQ